MASTGLTGQVCALPWCRQTGSHLTFQAFPDNEIRQMQWLTLLDVADTWKDVPPDKLQHYVICNLHFDTRGTLLRAISTPLVTTAHVSRSNPVQVVPVPSNRHQYNDQQALVSGSPLMRSQPGSKSNAAFVKSQSTIPRNFIKNGHCHVQKNPNFSNSASILAVTLQQSSKRSSKFKGAGGVATNASQWTKTSTKGKGYGTSDSESEADVEDQEYKPEILINPEPTIELQMSEIASFDVPTLENNYLEGGFVCDPSPADVNPSQRRMMSSHHPLFPTLPSHGNSKTPMPAFITPVPESGRWTRESFSLGKKMEILRHLENGMKQVDVCRMFNLPKSTAWSIWKNREKIETAFLSGSHTRKKLRKSRFEDVDSALFKWYTSVSSQNVAVTSRLLQAMAETFAQDLGQAEFVCTAGWLERFKQRNCINLNVQKKRRKSENLEDESAASLLGQSSVENPANSIEIENTRTNSVTLTTRPLDAHEIKTSPVCTDDEYQDLDYVVGEKSQDENTTRYVGTGKPIPTPTSATVCTDSSALAKDWITHTWPKLRMIKAKAKTKLMQNQKPDDEHHKCPSYSSSNIFSAEETGVLYRLSPQSAFKMYKNSKIESEFSDFSIAEERITVMLCANSDGSEKKRLCVFSQFKKPQCIVSVIGENFCRLPVDYRPTTDITSWINEESFERWLQEWDITLRDKENNRRILLALNFSPIHSAIPQLTNIEIILIPNQVASLLQPMQQGIIREFKYRYRRLQIKRIVYYLEQEKQESSISLLDAILMLSTAWCEISSEAISASFVKARIISEADQSRLNQNKLLINSLPSSPSYSFPGFDTKGLIETAVRLGLHIPPEWKFKDFVSVDDCLFAVDYHNHPTQQNHNQNNHQAFFNNNGIMKTNIPPTISDNNCMEADTEAETIGSQPNNPESTISVSEIQIYLDVIKVWAMTKGGSTSCPQKIHDALSTLESFAYDHLE